MNRSRDYFGLKIAFRVERISMYGINNIRMPKNKDIQMAMYTKDLLKDLY